MATLSLSAILYFLPDVISFATLNHLTFSSGLPEIVASKVAVSPTVTLIEGGLSTILAGSKIGIQALNMSSKYAVLQLKARY